MSVHSAKTTKSGLSRQGSAKSTKSAKSAKSVAWSTAGKAIDTKYPNLHWKLGQQTPSVGTLLAYLETMAWIIFF